METATQEAEAIEAEVQAEADAQEAPEGYVLIKTSGKVKETGEKREVTYLVHTGDDLDEAVDAHGHDAVFNRYVSGLRVAAGAFARGEIEKGSDPATIEEFMNSTWSAAYEPAGKIVDPVANARNAVARLSDDELAAILAERGIDV